MKMSSENFDALVRSLFDAAVETRRKKEEVFPCVVITFDDGTWGLAGIVTMPETAARRAELMRTIIARAEEATDGRRVDSLTLIADSYVRSYETGELTGEESVNATTTRRDGLPAKSLAVFYKGDDFGEVQDTLEASMIENPFWPAPATEAVH
jgi:hypothetical protein